MGSPAVTHTTHQQCCQGSRPTQNCWFFAYTLNELYNSVMETKSKEETERIIHRLRTALRLLGFTNREIERRLGYTPSYLTRLFSGQIELRFEHIVDIVAAMGMTAEEFFHFAYPPRTGERSEPAVQLNEILEELRPSSGRSSTGRNSIEAIEEDLERLTKVFQKNMDIINSRLREQIEREIDEQTERDREKRRERRAAKKSAAAGAKPSSEGSGKSRSR